jgi:aminoglycoside phosphotransferase (APT) family kinase protein
METSARRAAAIAAALEVAAAAGYPTSEPVVLQDTNNIVVRMAPHEVVAKVGVWVHSASVLGLEVDVCAHLSALDAPVAAPIGPLRSGGAASLPVSLWRWLAPVPQPRLDDGALAVMLRRVHDALSSYGGTLPSFLAGIDHARSALFDDARMAALPPDDLAMLRERFDRWTAAARQWPGRPQPLHGEPHTGNVVATGQGLRLIDFEAAGRGPLEWDLASLPPGVADEYDGVDRGLLTLLRGLNSARVATWCWALAGHPVMRANADHHLAVVRDAVPDGG